MHDHINLLSRCTVTWTYCHDARSHERLTISLKLRFLIISFFSEILHVPRSNCGESGSPTRGDQCLTLLRWHHAGVQHLPVCTILQTTADRPVAVWVGTAQTAAGDFGCWRMFLHKKGFGHQKEQLRKDWRIVHGEKLRGLYCWLCDDTRIQGQRDIRVVCVVQEMNAFCVMVGNRRERDH
jgi:hypothetical protein